MLSNKQAESDHEWKIIADLLVPGVELMLLAGGKAAVETSCSEVVLENPRPLPPGQGRKAREQWVTDYLQFRGAAARKEMVEASGVPNSTILSTTQNLSDSKTEQDEDYPNHPLAPLKI